MTAQFFAKADKSELYIYDAIGQDYFGDGITATSIKDALKEFKSGSGIDIYINSPGGSVFEGIAIYNQLMRWGGKKTVHVDGLAASIASVIMMAGDERIVAENSTVMIHRGWSIAMGNAADMRKMAESLDTVDDTILTTYVSRTGGNRDEISAWMDAETWMTAEQAVSRKFATSKSSPKTIKAEFPLLAKYQNVPQQLRRQAMAPNLLIAKANTRADKIQRRPAGNLA